MLERRAALAIFAAAPFDHANAQQMFSNAEAYENFMGRWSLRLALPLITFAGIPRKGRVLDIGSGTGALAFSIARLRPEIALVGIDPSEEYVKYSASQNRFGNRVAFRIGDAQKMDFPDSTFEASTSLLVFNFIPDPAKALREAKRVTKSGGSVSAAVWDYGAGMVMLRKFWDAAVKLNVAAGKLDEKHMPLCRRGELSRLWKDAGLEQVEEQSLEIAMQFATFADYWDPFLLGQGPAGAYVRSLDDVHRTALRNELLNTLAAGAEDKTFALAARAWAVKGLVAKA